MKIILATGKLVLVWPLHFLLMVISVALAAVLGVVYWVIWILVMPFPKRQTEARLPEVGDATQEISVESLLGPEAPGKIDAVFEGGGVKALAQIGAVQAIEQLGLSCSLLGGTSGGAIIASLLAAGRHSDQKGSEKIWEFLTEVGLHSLVDVWYLPPVGFLQRRLYLALPLLANLVYTKGMVSGSVFLREMKRILRKDDGQELRFKDLLNPEAEDDDDPARRYSLKMVATDISRGRPIVLPDDIPAYWEAWQLAKKLSPKPEEQLTASDVRDWWPVAESVRMSMSIPFFFRPVLLHLNTRREGKTKVVEARRMGQKGQRVHIVDGGVSSNFPIWLFDRLEGRPRWPTFGFLLDEHKDAPARPARVTRLLTDLAMSVVGTGMGAMDKRLSKHDEYRTARLGTMGISTTAFGLDPAKQEELVRSGFRDTAQFFGRFKWQDYLDQFRR